MGQIKNIKLHIVTDIKQGVKEVSTMGQEQCSMAEDELEVLLKRTKFNKEDIEKWYKIFMKSHPDGKMSRDQFHDIYGKVYTEEESISENIFKSFDHNGDGEVSFRELMITLSLSNAGSPEEKLKWLFDVYDLDGNGKITLDEVRNMADIFNDVDLDKNGYWTLDEFEAGVKKHPFLKKI